MASTSSLRYADPGAMMRTGGVLFSMVRIWTDDVCVRRSLPPSK